MQEVYNHVGIWKFTNKITNEELEQVAKEWATDENYLSLRIRKCSQDQHGIAFEYKGAGSTQEDFRTYMDETSDILKKRFGNALVGWDISNMYYKVK